jgi:hypothetical protein
MARQHSPHRWFLLAFYAIAIVWGIRHVYYWQQSLLDLLVPFALAIVMCSWSISDARARGRPLPTYAKPWFFLLAVLLVPLYRSI